MSIRAYKVNTMAYAKDPSFNVGEHYDLVEGLASWKSFNDSGEIYHIEFNRDEIQGEVNALKNIGVSDEKAIMILLNQILKDLGEDEYITYSCF